MSDLAKNNLLPVRIPQKRDWREKESHPNVCVCTILIKVSKEEEYLGNYVRCPCVIRGQ